MTTAILFNSYREKLIRSVTHWILLILPLVYFLVAYFYQFFLSNVLTYYFQNDPSTVSVLVSAFLTLSKPIGGMMFAFAFWNMSRGISYERKMKMSLVIAGWGIFFIFSANQAATQVVIPYPPFGITTVTALNVAAFLLLVGISASAINVSQDRELRREFYNSAVSKMNLLKTIGVAQMEKELIKKYESMVKRTPSSEEHTPFEKDDVKEALHGLVDEMDINKAREILRDVLTEIYAKSRTKNIS